MRYWSIHHDNGRGKLSGAKIILTESGRIEIGIYDHGMPPRFELLFCDQRGNVLSPPIGVTLEIERADGRRETFSFARFGNSLESTTDVAGPFEFDIRLTVPRDGGLVVHTFRFVRDAAAQAARQTPKALALGKCYAHHRL